MRTVVLLKAVPDPRHWHQLRLDPETRTLIRSGVPMAINPLDRHALEEAIRLREARGGEVIVISMAPPEAGPVLREALAFGADRAVLVSDRRFAGSDTLGTAHVLAEAVKALGGFDLVLGGDETIDGGTAQVSAQVAEFLGVANLMHVNRIEAREDRPWLVRSMNERGSILVEIVPPMVLSVVKGLNEPRYVTMMNVLEAEQKDLATWTAEDLPPVEPIVGLADSATQMADLFVPESGKRAEFLPGDPPAQATELADRLHRLGFC